MTKEEAAERIAQSIMDDDGEQENYQEYIDEGHDPRDHILYAAGVILGFEYQFEDEINNYLKGPVI